MWHRYSGVSMYCTCTISAVISKLHKECNLLFSEKSEVWNISNSTKLLGLRKSATLYCFLKLSKTASQTVQYCIVAKVYNRTNSTQLPFQFTLHIRKVRCTIRAIAAVFLPSDFAPPLFKTQNPRWCHNYYLLQYNCKNDFSTAFQNAKPPHPLMSSSVKTLKQRLMSSLKTIDCELCTQFWSLLFQICPLHAINLMFLVEGEMLR